jgi:small subunit ribosomal protein S16
LAGALAGTGWSRFEGWRRIWHNGGRTRLSVAPLSASGVSFELREPCPHADAVPAHPRQETGDTTDVAVKIRLKRMGKIHAPFYRVVIMNSRTKRDGRAIEEIGKYHPTQDPSVIEINSERVQYWLGVGAQPTEQVAALLKITGDWQKFKGLPGTEGTLRLAKPKADKLALFEKATNSAMAESKDGSTTARRKKSEPKADGAEKADKVETAEAKTEPKAEKAEPKTPAAEASADVKAQA